MTHEEMNIPQEVTEAASMALELHERLYQDTAGRRAAARNADRQPGDLGTTRSER
jgi:hypothetical protein